MKYVAELEIKPTSVWLRKLLHNTPDPSQFTDTHLDVLWQLTSETNIF